MLLDFISDSSCVRFNSNLANMIGLHDAIYLSELLSIAEKANRKGVTEDNYFKLDREYIKKRTTLDIEEQLKIDNKLKQLQILKVSDDCDFKLQVDVAKLMVLLSNGEVDESSLVQESEIKIKKKAKVSQRRAVFENLKHSIITQNKELFEAYCNWIDGVYANPKGFLSKRAVEIFQQKVEEFANHDLDVALAVIDIAATNGYRDADWALNKYREKSRTTLNFNAPQKRAVLGDDVF